MWKAAPRRWCQSTEYWRDISPFPPKKIQVIFVVWRTRTSCGNNVIWPMWAQPPYLFFKFWCPKEKVSLLFFIVFLALCLGWCNDLKSWHCAPDEMSDVSYFNLSGYLINSNKFKSSSFFWMDRGSFKRAATRVQLLRLPVNFPQLNFHFSFSQVEGAFRGTMTEIGSAAFISRGKWMNICCWRFICGAPGTCSARCDFFVPIFFSAGHLRIIFLTCNQHAPK